MTIRPFDAVLFFILLFFIIKVTRSGFIAEFFSKAAVILGCIGAVLFYKALSPHVQRIIGIDSFPGLVSFLLIFLVLYILVKMVQRIVGNAFEGESMKNLDLALGFFLGIIEGLLAIVLVIIILELQPWFDTASWTSNSIWYRLFHPVVFSGTVYIPELIKGY